MKVGILSLLCLPFMASTAWCEALTPGKLDLKATSGKYEISYSPWRQFKNSKMLVHIRLYKDYCYNSLIHHSLCILNDVLCTSFAYLRDRMIKSYRTLRFSAKVTGEAMKRIATRIPAFGHLALQRVDLDSFRRPEELQRFCCDNYGTGLGRSRA